MVLRWVRVFNRLRLANLKRKAVWIWSRNLMRWWAHTHTDLKFLFFFCHLHIAQRIVQPPQHWGHASSPTKTFRTRNINRVPASGDVSWLLCVCVRHATRSRIRWMSIMLMLFMLMSLRHCTLDSRCCFLLMFCFDWGHFSICKKQRGHMFLSWVSRTLPNSFIETTSRWNTQAERDWKQRLKERCSCHQGQS